jgi:hypothetical protein
MTTANVGVSTANPSVCRIVDKRDTATDHRPLRAQVSIAVA